MTIRQRWFLRILVVCIALMLSFGVFIAVPKTAQAAGAYNGRLPSSVSGCSSNVRAGSEVPSLYSSSTYYGWAEQRYSSTGNCAGYQWIRLHVTATMQVYNSEGLFWVSEDEDGGNNFYLDATKAVSNFNSTYDYGYIYAGTYDLQIMYVTSHQICGIIMNDGLFFGHSYTPLVTQGITGRWCA